MKVFGLLGCLLTVTDGYYTTHSWSYNGSPSMRSSVNNCSGKCCSGFSMGKAGQCSNPVKSRSYGKPISSTKPRFQSSYRSPQLQVIQPSGYQPNIKISYGSNPSNTKSIGKAWGSSCVHCTLNQSKNSNSMPRLVHEKIKTIVQPQRGCPAPYTRVGSSCKMVSGPSQNVGNNGKTSNCYRVGGCAKPQEQYEVAPQYEYNDQPRRRRDRPAIDLENDYHRLDNDESESTRSDDIDYGSDYELDCIDCQQVSEDSYGLTTMAGPATRPAPRQGPNQGYYDKEDKLSRERGWSSWNSWGSNGSEYHEKDGQHRRRQPPNSRHSLQNRGQIPNRQTRSNQAKPTYYNQMANTGQQMWTEAKALGRNVGKYSYSVGCFYYTC